MSVGAPEQSAQRFKKRARETSRTSVVHMKKTFGDALGWKVFVASAVELFLPFLLHYTRSHALVLGMRYGAHLLTCNFFLGYPTISVWRARISSCAASALCVDAQVFGSTHGRRWLCPIFGTWREIPRMVFGSAKN